MEGRVGRSLLGNSSPCTIKLVRDLIHGCNRLYRLCLSVPNGDQKEEGKADSGASYKSMPSHAPYNCSEISSMVVIGLALMCLALV